MKPGVETVEGTVKSVVGPVYEKVYDIPIELLKFIDRKVRNLSVSLRLLGIFLALVSIGYVIPMFRPESKVVKLQIHSWTTLSFWNLLFLCLIFVFRSK